MKKAALGEEKCLLSTLWSLHIDQPASSQDWKSQENYVKKTRRSKYCFDVV